MIRNSRDQDPLATMAAANPVAAEDLRREIAEPELARALRRAIAAGESPAQPIPAGDRVAREQGGSPRPRRGLLSHRRAALGLCGLASVLVAAALILLSGGSVESVKDGGHPTFAAAAVEVAEANPRLLITAPGWRIIHARGFEVDSGDLSWKDGNHPAHGPHPRGLEMSWYPARFYRSYLHDRAQVPTRFGQVKPEASTLLGHTATIFRFDGQHPNFAAILAPQGRVFIEIAGTVSSGEEFAAILRSLRRVGVEEWLRAMPAEVIRPEAQSGVIAQMLDGIPVPPGFDPSTLESETALTDHFTLAKALTGAVACGWLHRWLSATGTGDEAAAAEAVEAMSTARNWPILLQMVREKGYTGDALPPHGSAWPSLILTAAKEIAHGHLRRTPAVKAMPGGGLLTPAHVAPASAMGCIPPA